MISKAHIVYYKPKSRQEHHALSTVYSVLNEYGIKHTSVERNLFHHLQKDVDLVIVVGGDGTFLRASHVIGKTPVLGVNSYSNMKEGYLMQCTSKDFKQKFVKILDHMRVIPLLRLEVSINGKKLYPALNDIFVGHQLPYKLSRFDLTVNNKKEHQKCSGLIASTPAGSTAWTVGANGKILPFASGSWQYVVREQYQGRLHKHKLSKGVLGKKAVIKVNILNPNYLLSIDSLNDFKLSRGDVVTIKPSKVRLNYVDVR
jgi:NAD+ kinase